MTRPLQLALFVVAATSLLAQYGPGQQPPYDSQQGPPPGYGAGAQRPDPNSPDQVRPDQGVARISLINGEVSVRRGDSGDVTAAVVNAPLMMQDRLMTASTSRAEIEFDAANVLRVASSSEVRMADLQVGRYQVQVAIGTVTFTMLRNSQAQVELDLPSVAVRPTRPGAYRISVHEDGSAEITVRDGEAQVLTPTGSQVARVGSTMMVRGMGNDTEFQSVAPIGMDDWDRWNQQRDSYLLRAQSPRRVNSDIYGTEDLDQSGRWVQDPTYGQVWTPAVPPGWAPYQNGSWVWEDYYGWTWVSSDPWGWAPYHYGRWFYGPAGWCWYPGAYGLHYYWSPALVAFFGFGPHVGFGFGFGNIGWVALAPFEAFHGWWGRGYGRSAIIANVNVGAMYRNARFANGVNGMSSAAFGHGAGRVSPVSGSQLRTAGMIRGALPVAADRASMRFSDRAVNTSRFPQSANQHFYSRMSPAAQSGQRSGFGSAGSAASASGGWRRLNDPAAGSRAAGSAYQSQPRSLGAGGGWNNSAAGARGSYGAAPSYQAPRSYGGQAVRISPPIVRSYANSGSRATGTGGGSSQRTSSPSSHSSGGGGGASRGGSGGGHSGGGGHHGR